jgi:hypothetical protein
MIRNGCNPSNPAPFEDVLCWGRKCDGNFSATMGAGARCRQIQAIECECFRRKMGWIAPPQMIVIETKA